MSKPIEPGTEAAAIVEAEERLHGRVHARVAMGVSGGGGVDTGQMDRELIELRDAIGEAKPEDIPPLVEQMTRLAALRARVGKSKSLPVDIRSPYFAHMLLREGAESRDVLIGKRGFIDRDANVRIVDWRNAAVSQVYYRYDEGDDYDEEIDGRELVGIVEVRRNVSIAGSKLRRIGAPQGTFVRDARNVWHEAVGSMIPVLQGGSGKAARAPRRVARRGSKDRGRLGVHHGSVHRPDKHLPEIAALIDREQFDLITRPEAGLLVIQGGAGSGKTTVALHRVAYMSFADRQRFAPHKMLVVVPSEALARYVEGVLPALGIQGVPVLTYARWARNLRWKLLPHASKKLAGDAPDEVCRVKKHPALLPILEDYAADQLAAVEGELPGATADRWRALEGEPLVPRLRALWHWLDAGADGMATAERAVAENVVTRLGKRANDIVSDWGELMTDFARLRAGFDRHAFGDVRDGELRQTIEWCAVQVASAETAIGVDGSEIQGLDGRSVDDEQVRGRFDVNDDPILLRMIQLKRGGLVHQGRRTVYEHVAIDEAQDRSAIEIKVLLEATTAPDGNPSGRSVTIAGDTAQRLVFDNAFTDWRELLAHTGHDDVVIQPLRLSYRSTAEVMLLAREILGPDLAPKDPLVARSGAPVDMYLFGDVGESVGLLADALRALTSREPMASVAVIARYAAQADVYYEGLRRAEVANMRRVNDQDFSFRPGIDVTDVAQVKGLEFDYVILIDVNASSYPDSVEARHLMHIGATRAAHQLWLLAAGDPSPLIPKDMVG